MLDRNQPDIVSYINRVLTNRGFKEHQVGRKKRNYPKRSEIIRINTNGNNNKPAKDESVQTSSSNTEKDILIGAIDSAIMKINQIKTPSTSKGTLTQTENDIILLDDTNENYFVPKLNPKKSSAATNVSPTEKDILIVDTITKRRLPKFKQAPIRQCSRCTRVVAFECKNQECILLRRNYLCEWCDEIIHRRITTSEFEWPEVHERDRVLPAPVKRGPKIPIKVKISKPKFKVSQNF